MLNRSSKLSLILLLLVFTAALGVVADQAARAAVSAAQAAHSGANPSQVYLFAIVLMMAFLLLTTLPVLMVIAYRGLQGDMLDAQVRASLRLCALDDDELKRRLDEYQERNSFSAFVLPSVVNLFLLYLIWDITLLPNGLLPLVQGLGDSAHPTSMASLLGGLSDALSPLTWTLLGGYFYALASMIRRWMLADLTTNWLWKIDVRLVLTLILGLLLGALDSGAADAAIGPWIAGVGFLIGIVPDLFLRWLAQQIKRVAGIDAMAGGLFAPSELQRKIEGMSFWQVDRLGEEGIESVQA
jgi:hypothetical protein